MRIQLIATAAVLALGLAGSANATTYISQLEYQGVSGPISPSFGTVTLTDGLNATAEHPEGTRVQVTVTLTNPNSLFVNTGGPHDPFLFNLTGDYAVTVPTAGFYNGGHDADTTVAPNLTATPFGNFTNKIGCCSTWVPDQQVESGFHFEGTGKSKHKVIDYVTIPAHWQENTGAANGIAGPLTFFVDDLNGITFAGLGAILDPDNGKLLSLGTGDRFASNAGGWWFSADIFDASAGLTYNVAARDAFGPFTPGVPEPASWMLMILGFGATGAFLRRRRAALFA